MQSICMLSKLSKRGGRENCPAWKMTEECPEANIQGKCRRVFMDTIVGLLSMEVL